MACAQCKVETLEYSNNAWRARHVYLTWWPQKNNRRTVYRQKNVYLLWCWWRDNEEKIPCDPPCLVSYTVFSDANGAIFDM